MKQLLTGMLLALLVLPLGAKQMYKWQDENGVWHFTDQEPVTDRPVESEPLKVTPKARLAMRNVGSERQPVYAFYNHLYGPMQVEVAFEDATNVRSEPPLPSTFLLEERQEKSLVEVFPVDPAEGFRFRIASRYVAGAPGAKHDDSYAYLPPFPSNAVFPISQGFGGQSTHTENHALYAVDIVMPEGTPVLAARDGVVMDVEDDFFESGTDASRYGDKANIVRVLHEDGTMAVYAHLELDSIVVRPGTGVVRGDPIARSGNTGFSSGPHLHFAVQQNAEMELRSIPFRFATSNGGRLLPDRPMNLQGVRP